MSNLTNLLSLAFLALQLNPLWAQQKDISIADIWEAGKFASKHAEGFNFLQNSNYYTRLENTGEQSDIMEYNLATGQATRSLYTTPKGMKVLDYSFSADEKKILLGTEYERIYRYSYQANFYVWDTETRKLSKVSEKGKQQHATLNPQGDKVAFMRGNNLYYKDLLTDEEVQITTDGEPNKIINGGSDWVYEEEFAISRAFEWSPDGQKIAFLRFDESLVREFRLTYYRKKLYPIEEVFKYPKAGELNSQVSVHLYDLPSKKLQPVQLKSTEDQYIPRLKWTPDGRLCVTQLNRLQNELKLVLVDVKKGSIQTLLEEQNKAFIDIHDHLTFLANDQFLWTSDQDGYLQLYLYDLKTGKQIRKITKDNFDLDEIYGVDEKNGWVYFQASTKEAYNKEICRVAIKTGKLEILSKEKGSNRAQFSSNFQYFVLEHSTATTPNTTQVIETATGKSLRTIIDNEDLKKVMAEYRLGKHEFFTVKNRQGQDLNGWRILPPDFDPKKKYPVFMYVYGGPGAQTVVNGWDDRNYFWFQMLAQKGYIVVSVDGRGTGSRGEAFRKATYLQLGKYETEDQIDVARYLGSLDYVDKNRIGIFGWSFGGYLSTLCLAKGAAEFKMAIAVAPVINWKWYDTIYTERYMRTPQENPRGYEDNSPINFASQIRGKYLLVHGLTDDNVHFQHAAEMASALIENNIPFEEAFYPNKNHGIYGGYTRSHLYNKMTNFILNNL
jgi:dipeptidyl-peptidase-4